VRTDLRFQISEVSLDRFRSLLSLKALIVKACTLQDLSEEVTYREIGNRGLF